MILPLIMLNILFPDSSALLNNICRKISREEVKGLLDGNVLDINFKHNILPQKMLEILINKEKIKFAKEKAELIIEESKKMDITILSIFDEAYPKNLKMIDDAPLILYVKGNINENIEYEKAISCVGTRRNSLYGKTLIDSIIPIFSEERFVIISGLALGIDTLAHKCCINSGGITIAVLPNGLDSIYPKSNYDLAECILQNNGLLVSEYPVGEKPLKHRFVKRNRIVSGLSKAVLVIEALTNSGTLHTVNFAEKQNRIITYPIQEKDIPQAQGVLKLKEEGRGFELKNTYDCYRLIDILGYRSSVGREAETYNLIKNSFKELNTKNIKYTLNQNINIVSKFNNDSNIFKELSMILKDKNIDADELINTLVYLIVKSNKNKF